jgi:hypothetical protein
MKINNRLGFLGLTVFDTFMESFLPIQNLYGCDSCERKVFGI